MSTSDEKAEKLEKLDGLVLKAMIDALDEDKLEVLPLLSTAVNYLKSNNLVQEKNKDTDVIEENRKRLADAQKRRDKQGKKGGSS